VQPDQWTIVLAERDPYSKVISLASMRLNFRPDRYAGTIPSGEERELKDQLKEIFRAETYTQVFNLPLYSGSERFARTVVLRQESLRKDLERLLKELRLGSGLKAWPVAKRGPMCNRETAMRLLSRDQIEQVNEFFACEFKTFG
jgi:hypothetical protein